MKTFLLLHFYEIMRKLLNEELGRLDLEAFKKAPKIPFVMRFGWKRYICVA